MSWAAWSAISSAPRRLASSAGAPLARAVAASGHPVDVLPEPSVAALLDLARRVRLVWLADDAEAERFPTALATAIVDGSDVEVEVLHASYDVPGARLLDLVTVMDRLRTECPWDREQTHRSLATYLLEETYETLEAIEALGDEPDYTHLREELGDLLLQVYFHARIASEAPDTAHGFTIDDVAADIVDKLVHRHPHVFAGLDVADADEVERNWDALKAAEKGRASVLDGIPPALPALALADKVLGRAAKIGLTPEAGPGPDRRLTATGWATGCSPSSWRPGPPAWTPSRSCATPSAASPSTCAPPNPLAERPVPPVSARAAAARLSRPARGPSRSRPEGEPSPLRPTCAVRLGASVFVTRPFDPAGAHRGVHRGCRRARDPRLARKPHHRGRGRPRRRDHRPRGRPVRRLHRRVRGGRAA